MHVLNGNLKIISMARQKLSDFRSGKIPSFPQELIPREHGLHHSWQDEWACVCDVCRSALQRRRRSKCIFSHKSPLGIPRLEKYGACILMDTQDYGEGVCFDMLRWDNLVIDCGCGWTSLVPMSNATATAQAASIKSISRSTDKVVSDADSSILAAAQRLDADHNSSVPYRPKENPAERVEQDIGDRMRSLLVQARLQPFWRPLASRFASAIWNLFQEVPRTLEDGSVVYGTPYKHRFNEEVQFLESDVLLIGSLARIVHPKELQARGQNAIMLGLHEDKGSHFDKSIIVADLDKLIEHGRIKILQRFSYSTWCSDISYEGIFQLRTLRGAQNINQLSIEQQSEAIGNIGSAGDMINWVGQYVLDTDFAETVADTTWEKIQSLPLDEDF